MNPALRPSRLAFRFLEATFSVAFLVTVVHHVGTYDFKPLAALCAPILILYCGFTSLLFVRGKSLADGPWAARSLHAAERAMQATVWHLLGIVLGVSVYGLLRLVEVPFGPDHYPKSIVLVLFAAPYALMQAGLLSFLRAIWILVPHLSRRVGAFEVRRRVRAARRAAEAVRPALPAFRRFPVARRCAAA